MYPVFWIMTPILMGYFYLRSKSGETAYAKLREALEETDRTRFLELMNVSFITSQESLSVLMVLSGVATIVMAVIGESSSFRRYRNLEAEEGMLDRLDIKFAEIANQDQPAAG